jgi:hypothetical protein
MSNLVKLIPPRGTDEANFNESSFKIREDGSIWVCPEAVDGLTRIGGFTIAPDQAATVTVTAARIAELEREESELRAAKPAPTIAGLVMPV